MQGSLTDARRRALRSASWWYAQLNDPQVTPLQTRQWQQWMSGNTDNQWAWQQVEALRQQITDLPAGSGRCLLKDSAATRRSVLKGLLLLFGGAATDWPVWHSDIAEGLRADYHTAKGQMMQQQLADGSSLALNTGTAVNIRFDPQQRLVRLLYGDIAITTGKDSLHRPFRVQTRQGVMTALGTVFSVRQDEESTLLTVSEHAVQVGVPDAPGQFRLVRAGESLRFTRHAFSAIQPADPQETGWQRGILSFSDQPLSEVVATLSRYHRGLIRCTGTAGEFRLSGTFPIFNLKATLTAISATLPVTIHTLTQYVIVISNKR